MPSLIAMSPADGWAIVEDPPGMLTLLRPPYVQSSRTSISEAEAERLLRGGGFQLTTETFDDWGAIVQRVTRTRIDAAGAERLERAQSAPLRVLRRATADQVRTHIERIRSVVGTEDTVALRRIVVALLEAPAVDQDAQLRRECIGLLRRLEEVPLSLGGLRERRRCWSVDDSAAVEQRDQEISATKSLLNFPPAA